MIDNSLTNVAMMPGIAMPMPPLQPVPPVRPPGSINPPAVIIPQPSRPHHAPPHPVSPILKGSVSVGLRVEKEDVRIEITDQVAKTYVTQTFFNDTDRNLAGTYLFPLPEDTTFSSFSLHIDGKPVEGKILEASEARQQYEEIVRKMVDPGLLEYADYKTVRARIFPIPAHGSKKVELEYTQVLKADNGLLKYRFPLKSETEGANIEDVKINLKLSSKQSVRTIWSPSHEITSKKIDDHHATISFDAQDYSPDKDFLMYYSVSDKELAANTLTHKNTGEDGYFLFSVTPPMTAVKAQPKDVVLTVDTSGSMQGEKISQAKRALAYIVNALNAEDRFGIVQFNTDVESFQSNLVSATPENKKKAMAFIEGLEARGGTNIGDALSTGTTMLHEATSRPGYVILMTDGEPTVGDTTIDKLMKRADSKRDIRLFDFGVGYDVNTRLLNKLADAHHGYSQYVEPKEDLEAAMSGFYQKIKSPMLSDVKITFDGVQAKDMYPREVKDIFAGSQVLLIGKYKTGGKGTVHLTGSINGAQKSYAFPVDFANEETSHTYLPRLWAMRRIGHLTEVAQANGNSKEVVDEIVALSKQYGIISAYTSFLVTDPSENGRLASTSFNRRVMNIPSSSTGTKGMSFHKAHRAVNISDSLAAAPLAYSASAQAPLPSALPSARLAMASGRAGGGGGDLDRIADKASVSMDERFLGSAGGFGAVSTGKDAVSVAKQMNALKSTTVAYSGGSGIGGATVKVIEDKTFYSVDGVWTDSSYKADTKQALKKVSFGTDEYFDLVRKNPGIAKYLSVGQRVILMFKGTAYEITAPATQAS
jgi:Ca-activated chloride channel family protein